MGMYENFSDIVKLFYHDDQLLRLLYYPPTNFTSIKDPLDPSLQNMTDNDADWKIRLDRILSTPKSDDLVNTEICRIYVYAGRRRPQSGNFKVANQELIIDILCHSKFENGDFRSLRISDRINDLLIHEHVTGLGKMDYIDGGQAPAPNNYVGYRHVYTFGSTKS